MSERMETNPPFERLSVEELREALPSRTPAPAEQDNEVVPTDDLVLEENDGQPIGTPDPAVVEEILGKDQQGNDTQVAKKKKVSPKRKFVKDPKTGALVRKELRNGKYVTVDRWAPIGTTKRDSAPQPERRDAANDGGREGHASLHLHRCCS
ncbi:hypothetical protein AAVH_22535 [Aphelenchoides avenae]|nr:hypothetical protein AAVH_22535 [Aphelenchus avenae]